MGLIKKLRKAKKEAPPNEKPAVVKTHLRNMIIVPEMIGSVVGIYNGKVCVFRFVSVVGWDVTDGRTRLGKREERGEGDGNSKTDWLTGL